MMIPAELSRAADLAGLVVKECGNVGHFQILGGILKVNYYPLGKRRTAYVEGMAAAHHYVSPDEAVALALAPKGIPEKKQPRRKSYAKVKRRMYAKSDKCYRCHKPILVYADVTIEHKVPLSQGGLDHTNNLALSHRSCNEEAGNAMPKGRK